MKEGTATADGRVDETSGRAEDMGDIVNENEHLRRTLRSQRRSLDKALQGEVRRRTLSLESDAQAQIEMSREELLTSVRAAFDEYDHLIQEKEDQIVVLSTQLEEEKKFLSSELEKKKSELASSFNNVKEIIEDVSQKEDQYRHLQKEYGKLCSRAQEFDKVKADLRKTIEVEKEAKSDVMRKLSIAEKDAQRWRDRLDETEFEMRQQSSKIETLQSLLSSERDSFDEDLKAKVAAEIAKQHRMQSRIEQLESQIVQLNQEHVANQDQHGRSVQNERQKVLDAERSVREAKLENKSQRIGYEATIANLTTRIVVLEGEVQREKDMLQSSEGSAQNSLDQADKIRDEVMRIQAEYLQQISTLEANLLQAERDRAGDRGTIKRLTTNVEASRKQVASLEESVVSLKSQLSAQKHDPQYELKKYEAVVAQLEKEIEIEQQALFKVQQTAGEVSTNLELLTEKYEDEVSKSVVLSAEIEGLKELKRTERERSERRVASLEDEVRSLRKQLAYGSSDQDQIASKVEHLEAIVRDRDETIRSLTKEDIPRLETEKKRAEREAQDSISSLRKRLEEVIIESKSSEAKSRSLDEERSMELRMLERDLQSIIDSQRRHIKTLELRLEDQKSASLDMSKEGEALTAKQKERIKELEDRVSSHMADIDCSKSRAMEEIASLKGVIKGLEFQLETEKSKNVKLLESLDKSNDRVKQLLEQEKTFEASAQTLREEVVAKEAATLGEKEKVQVLSAQLKASEESLAQERARATSLASEVRELETKLREVSLQQDSSRSSQEVSKRAMDDEIQRLKLENESLSTKLVTERSNSAAERHRLTNEFQTHLEEVRNVHLGSPASPEQVSHERRMTCAEKQRLEARAAEAEEQTKLYRSQLEDTTRDREHVASAYLDQVRMMKQEVEVAAAGRDRALKALQMEREQTRQLASTVEEFAKALSDVASNSPEAPEQHTGEEVEALVRPIVELLRDFNYARNVAHNHMQTEMEDLKYVLASISKDLSLATSTVEMAKELVAVPVEPQTLGLPTVPDSPLTPISANQTPQSMRGITSSDEREFAIRDRKDTVASPGSAVKALEADARSNVPPLAMPPGAGHFSTSHQGLNTPPPVRREHKALDRDGSAGGDRGAGKVKRCPGCAALFAQHSNLQEHMTSCPAMSPPSIVSPLLSGMTSSNERERFLPREDSREAIDSSANILKRGSSADSVPFGLSSPALFGSPALLPHTSSRERELPPIDRKSSDVDAATVARHLQDWSNQGMESPTTAVPNLRPQLHGVSEGVETETLEMMSPAPRHKSIRELATSESPMLRRDSATGAPSLTSSNERDRQEISRRDTVASAGAAVRAIEERETLLGPDEEDTTMAFAQLGLDIQHHLQEVKSENAQLKAKIAALNEELESIRSSNLEGELSREVEELKRQLQSVTEERDEFVGRVEYLESELRENIPAIADAQATAQKVKELLDSADISPRTSIDSREEIATRYGRADTLMSIEGTVLALEGESNARADNWTSRRKSSIVISRFDCWEQLRDESGGIFYYNNVTGECQNHSPLIDATSDASNPSAQESPMEVSEVFLAQMRAGDTLEQIWDVKVNVVKTSSVQMVTIFKVNAFQEATLLYSIPLRKGLVACHMTGGPSELAIVDISILEPILLTSRQRDHLVSLLRSLVYGNHFDIDLQTSGHERSSEPSSPVVPRKRPPPLRRHSSAQFTRPGMSRGISRRGLQVVVPEGMQPPGILSAPSRGNSGAAQPLSLMSQSIREEDEMDVHTKSSVKGSKEAEDNDGESSSSEVKSPSDVPTPPAAPPAPPPPPPPPAVPSLRASAKKTKTLFWTKLGEHQIQRTVWEGVNRFDGPAFDHAELESAFIRESRKSLILTDLHSPRQKYLTLQRSNHVEISLSRLSLTRDQVAAAILQLDDDALSLEDLQVVKTMLPTEPEETMLQSADLDDPELTTGEKFCCQIMQIPEFRKKIDTFIMALEFHSAALALDQEIADVCGICDHIMSSTDLQQLLKVLLDVGNHLNYGTSYGDAMGFQVRDFTKFAEMKSVEGPNLLQWICQYILETTDESLWNRVKEDLVHVKYADEVVQDLETKLERSRSVIDTIKEYQSEITRKGANEIFVSKMEEYISKMEAKMSPIFDNKSAMDKKSTRLMSYFAFEDTHNIADFLSLMSAFIEVMDTAYSSAQSELEHPQTGDRQPKQRESVILRMDSLVKTMMSGLQEVIVHRSSMGYDSGSSDHEGDDSFEAF